MQAEISPRSIAYKEKKKKHLQYKLREKATTQLIHE